MKSEDFMIGNYLFKEGIIVKIDARTIFDICNDEEFKKYKPIPLTEEWLLKFGFSGDYWKSKPCYNSTFNKLHINLDVNRANVSERESWNDDYNEICLSENMKYVHQLQNLYFALTGEELKII